MKPEFIAWCMECIRLFTQDPQRKCTVVIDLAYVWPCIFYRVIFTFFFLIMSDLIIHSGFGMSNMDWKATLFFSKCLEAYYPEVRPTFIRI